MGIWSGALSTTATIAVGAVGAVALTVLYLLRLRRREVVVSFAPLWLGAPGARRQTRWAERLRHWLSLLLALAIYGLVLLAAFDPRPAARDGAGRSLVILIDRSASMAARDESTSDPSDGTRLAAARARARAVVGGLYPADRALVASFAADAAAESGFETDPARLRRAVDAVAPSTEAGDLDRALAFAAAVLRGRPHPTIVLVSDGGFSADALRLPPALAQSTFATSRSGGGPATSASSRSPPGACPPTPARSRRRWRSRTSATPRPPSPVQIRAGGAPVDRFKLTLAAHERRRRDAGAAVRARRAAGGGAARPRRPPARRHRRRRSRRRRSRDRGGPAAAPTPGAARRRAGPLPRRRAAQHGAGDHRRAR